MKLNSESIYEEGIQVIEFTSTIDKSENNPEWDQFVINSDTGSFFQTSSWAKVKRTQGWDALRVIAKSPAGSISGGIQVLYRKLFGVVLILQLVYGPLYDQESPEMGLAILDEVKQYFRKRPFFLFVQPFENNWEFYKTLQNSGYGTNLHVDLEQTATIIVDVSKSKEDILRQLKSGKRHQIRQSQTRGLVCSESTNREDLDIFYELHKNIANRRHFKLQRKDFFEALWDQFMPEGCLHLFIDRKSVV
jgi:lipid II:glycine glycyltransferase (peptidoglycan interpeptide bridge formation enzyme)